MAILLEELRDTGPISIKMQRDDKTYHFIGRSELREHRVDLINRHVWQDLPLLCMIQDPSL